MNEIGGIERAPGGSGAARRPDMGAAGFGPGEARFSGLLARARVEGAHTPSEAREAAADFVSMALVEPVFKTMREPMVEMPEVFRAGEHERMFRGYADALIARQITRSEGWGLIDSVAHQLSGGVGGIMDLKETA